MIGKFLWVFLCVVLLQDTTSDNTILFYGDSLTAGYGLSQEEAFPALIEKKIKQQGKSWKVINAGLSGETTAGGLSLVGPR